MERKFCFGKIVGYKVDLWLNNSPFQFSILCNVTLSKNVLVAKVIEKGSEWLKFRRALVDRKLEKWTKFQNLCQLIELTSEEDKISWKLTGNGSFTIKSFYKALQVQHTNFRHQGKIPPRVKVFVWLLVKNSIFTKDNLLKRGWKDKESKCQFCVEN